MARTLLVFAVSAACLYIIMIPKVLQVLGPNCFMRKPKQQATKAVRNGVQWGSKLRTNGAQNGVQNGVHDNVQNGGSRRCRWEIQDNFDD